MHTFSQLAHESSWLIVSCKTTITTVNKNDSIWLQLKEDELKNSILCVFANKQDIEGAMTASEVANSLGNYIVAIVVSC